MQTELTMPINNDFGSDLFHLCIYGFCLCCVLVGVGYLMFFDRSQSVVHVLVFRAYFFLRFFDASLLDRCFIMES
jgi:hypothetical protein